LARSGTIAERPLQLANVLTIRELQNSMRGARINTSPAKKLDYLFG
jgi:hypothetical protein